MNRFRSWLPLTCLFAYGILFAAQALSLRDLLAYDDHPGQFVRLWMGRESLRHGAWTADWHPEWFAGYPELQFYPPGFVILGLLILGITGGQLPLETVYQFLLWVIYLLPGVTTFLLLRTLTSSPWAALPPAFVALTLSAGVPSGVEEGMRWGMIGARLGLGLLPLLALSLLPWAREGQWPTWTAPLLAAILLAHPYQFVPALLLVVLTGGTRLWSLTQRRGEVAAQAAALFGLGLGLAAFWLLPLLLRLTYTLPMVWSHGEWSALLFRPILLPVLLAYLLGVAFPLRKRAEAWSLRVALAALPPALLLVVGINHLIEGWGVWTLDPDRLRDAVVYGLLWTGGLGWAWGVERLSRDRAPWASLVAALLVALTPQNDRDPDLTLWPTRQPWPTVRQVETPHQLPAVRAVLRDAPPGRILFSTSAVRLEEGDAWYLPHSHLFAMIPIQINREILNGTFTHPSPIAGLIYTGSARPPGIFQLVEERDGRQLFGQPSSELDPVRLNRLLTSLKVSAVVVPRRDTALITRLEGTSLFEPPMTTGSFRVFRVRAPTGMPTWQGHRTLQLTVSAPGGEWVGTGLFAYPLWTARGPDGALLTRENPERLLEVFVPPGKGIAITLHYQEGAVEWAGVALTLLSLGAWGIAVGWRRHSVPRFSDLP